MIDLIVEMGLTIAKRYFCLPLKNLYNIRHHWESQKGKKDYSEQTRINISQLQSGYLAINQRFSGFWNETAKNMLLG